MNPRHLVLAVLYILELQERIAEQDKELAEYKRQFNDPHTVKRMFDFWVESGVFPEYYN